MSKQRLAGALIIVVIIAVGTWVWRTQNSVEKKNRHLNKLTIATISPSFTSYSVYVAKEEGFFEDQGLDVTLQPYPHGTATLNALVERKAEFATCSETPFMHAILRGAEIYALATTVTAEKHLAIVARKDKGISDPKDLRNKTIGVTLGTNGEYFMESVLLLNGLSRNQVKAVHLKPGQMFDALINGEVDAIATWNPQMYKARKELGDQGSTFYAEGLYAPFFVISARQDYVHDNADVIERVLRSLRNASRFIQDNPDRSRKIVAQHLNIDEALLSELTATYRFKTSLDQSFLLTLENQASWAIRNELTKQTTIPNFLNSIYLDGLAKVGPRGVTIIR